MAEYLKEHKQITIVEGERRALKLSLAGVLAVGLQGVWSFSQKSRGAIMLPQLQQILHLVKNLRVEVCFDADYKDKPKVASAIFHFMTALTDEGVQPVYVALPGPGKGVDDYLLEHSVDD
jgi:hypothetical protein